MTVRVGGKLYVVYNDFLESPQGRLLAYRKRRNRKFDFWWSGTFQTKSSRTHASDAAFQSKLLAQMNRIGKRGPFTGPVFVEFQYSVASNQSPDAHSLTKHYLDLLMAPVAGVHTNRSRILLRDDSQVQILSSTYNAWKAAEPRERHKDAGQETLRLRVARLSDLLEDLRLYEDIRNGLLGQGFEFEEESDDDDDAVHELRRFYASKDSFIQRYGCDTYNAWELMLKRDAQKSILSRRNIQPSLVSSLLGPRFHRFKDDAQMKILVSSASRMVRSVYGHPLASADFGHRPLKHGDSKLFRARVRSALQSLKENSPVLFPLLTPCGVTVFYIPPAKSMEKVDLDNLARKAIIPAVHEILQPPATPFAFLTALNSGRESDPKLAELIGQYEKAPKLHVASYAVFCLSRIDGDAEDGDVKLLLHSGDPSRTTCTLLDSALTEWEDRLSLY